MRKYSVPGGNVHRPLEGGLKPAGPGGAEKKHREKKDKDSKTTWTTWIYFVIDSQLKSERNYCLEG